MHKSFSMPEILYSWSLLHTIVKLNDKYISIILKEYILNVWSLKVRFYYSRFLSKGLTPTNTFNNPFFFFVIHDQKLLTKVNVLLLDILML